jgi:Predicted membrane protein
MRFRAAEAREIAELEKEAGKAVKMLKGRKTSSPRDAYYFLEQLPSHLLAFVQVETRNSKVLGKIRNYLSKWRPLRMQLPAEELAALGVPRGPKFDKILLDLFHLQLNGKARNPTDRTRVLRQLAGIKPEPKKPKVVEPPEKTVKAEAGKKKGKAALAAEASAEKPAVKPAEAAASKSGKKETPAPAPAKPEIHKKGEPAKAPAPKPVPQPAKKKAPVRKPGKSAAKKAAKPKVRELAKPGMKKPSRKKSR